jgi:hypothetical protein
MSLEINRSIWGFVPAAMFDALVKCEHLSI